MILVQQSAILDDLLAAHAPAMGADYVGYHNHAYRVLNLCAALSTRAPAQLEKMALAAAFHDLGIWTARSFDYLPPSLQLARDHLAGSARADWVPELDAMIAWHHKILPYRAQPSWLVEPFRRADWIDVSHGLLSFGLPSAWLRELFSAFPDAGFHVCLLRLSLKRLFTHPWSPLPMMRL